MSDVFISYPHQAKADASSLARTLEQKGLTTWLAYKDLSPGSDSKAEIEEALRQSVSIVFLVYSRWKTSPWLHDEYMHALESYWSDRSKILVPVIVGTKAEIPTFLRQWPSLKVHNKSDWGRVATQLARWIESNQQIRNEPSRKEKEELKRRLSAITKAAYKWRSDLAHASAQETSGDDGRIVSSSEAGGLRRSGKKKNRASQGKP